MKRTSSRYSLSGALTSGRGLLASAAILASTASLAANHVEVPILLYGPIVPDSEITDWRVTRSNFEAHMQALANDDYNTITLDEYHAHLENGASLPSKPIILTFTNGYRHLLTHVDGVLNQHGFTGSVFLVTNAIGSSAANRQTSEDWDEDEPTPVVENLIWSEVETLANNGRWEIGSHTRSHKNFSEGSTAAERQSEIVGSKQDIEDELGADSVRYFSYPNAQGTDITSVRNLVEANYDLALGVKGPDTDTGPTDPNDPYALPRLYVRDKHEDNIFHADLLGGGGGTDEHHPADSNQDEAITLAEVIAYGKAWREDSSWERGPSPPTLAYVINAGGIWRIGGGYRSNPDASGVPWESRN